MALNPMQRRAKNSMIIGLVIGLVIGLILVGLMYVMLTNVQKELQKEKAKQKTVTVAAKDIESNNPITATDIKSEVVITSLKDSEIVTPSMLSKKAELPGDGVSKTKLFGTLPALPIGNLNNTNNTNNTSNTTSANNNTTNTENTTNTTSANTNTNTSNTPNTTNTNNTNNANNAANANAEYVAKVRIPKGTIITKDMILLAAESKKQDTLRLVEYNMITLPSELKDGETVDIRISFPTGQDYVVISKKIVEKSDATTIWFKLSEEEILTLNSAIVEAYLIAGAKLYAVTYTDPGIQPIPNQTYPVNDFIKELVGANPNIATELKVEFKSLMGSVKGREQITALMNGSEVDKIGTAVEKEIKDRLEKRKKYIEELTGATN